MARCPRWPRAVPVGHGEFRVSMAPGCPLRAGFQRGHQRVVPVTAPQCPQQQVLRERICHGATTMVGQHCAVPKSHTATRGTISVPPLWVNPYRRASPPRWQLGTGGWQGTGTGGFGGCVSQDPWMLDRGDPKFNPTYGAGRRCPRCRWVVTAEKCPPGSTGEALTAAGGGRETHVRARWLRHLPAARRRVPRAALAACVSPGGPVALVSLQHL